MAATLNPLEAALARQMFAAGCQQMANLEIIATAHAIQHRKGGDLVETGAPLRLLAIEMAHVWHDWIKLLDLSRVINSADWIEFMGGVGGRGKNWEKVGPFVVRLVEESIKYAVSGDARPLEVAALSYGWSVLSITRGWKQDDPPAASQEGPATASRPPRTSPRRTEGYRVSDPRAARVLGVKKDARRKKERAKRAKRRRA